MLNSQRNFVEYLEQVNALVKEAGLDKSKEKLIKSIKEQELLVPIVGNFNAGKSTALNIFLDENVLSTASKAETALATELRYTDGESYVEGVKENRQSLSLTEFSTLKDRASEFQFVRLYLNNKRLKDIAPIVLVDMPGFNSPIQAHDKAILRYLQFGTHFIVVEDIEKGTLTMDIKNHIHDLQNLKREFSFALTKCDIPQPSVIDEVKNAVSKELKNSFGYDKTIFCLNDKGGLDKVVEAMKPDEIFERLYKNELKIDFMDTKSALQTKIASLKADKDEAQNAIRTLDNAVYKVSQASQSLTTDTNEQAINAAIASINAVTRKLRLQMSEIANVASSGTDIMCSRINDIVRGVLLAEFNAQTKKQQERVLAEFKEQISDLNLSTFKIDSAWIENISEQINSSLSGVNIGVKNNWFDDLLDDHNIRKLFQDLSKLIAELDIDNRVKAILLSIINTLPSILKTLFGGNRIDEDELAAKILSTITEKLQNEIQNAYSSNFETIRKIVEKALEGKLKEKQAEINTAQEQKAQILGELNDKIQALSGVSGELDSLANKYLYT